MFPFSWRFQEEKPDSYRYGQCKHQLVIASNLLSLGCTDLVGDGMTKISTVFLNMIVNRELLPQVKTFINSQINAFTQQQKAQDAQHRTFVVTSISYTNTKGLVFTACPK